MGDDCSEKKTLRRSARKRKAASQDVVIDEIPVKKRSGGIRLSDEPVDIPCTWQDCSEHFTDYIKYIHHGEDHALSVEGNDKGEYPCGYNGCSHQATHSIYLAKHVAYHVYHDRLKNIGNNVLARADLPKCYEVSNFEIPTVDYDYECKWDICTHISGTLHEYMAHIQTHIRDNKPNVLLSCKWITCQGKYNGLYKLIEHVRSHTKEKTIACPTCGTMFASNTKFIDHRKRQIPMEMLSFQCKECYKLFATERLLRDHIRLHINHFKCTMCDMTTTKKSVLASHIRIRHLDERSYKCTLCEHACATKHTLEQHLTTHCADKLMACEECDFKCRSVYGLDMHYYHVHGQGTLPVYECHCCKKTFNRGGNLSKHLIEEHGFNWPSGHSRFKYKMGRDGILRLNTVRYESLEVSQANSTCAPPINKNIKYDIKKKSTTKDGVISIELDFLSESMKGEESRNSEEADDPNVFEDRKEVDSVKEGSENEDSSSITDVEDFEEESENANRSSIQDYEGGSENAKYSNIQDFKEGNEHANTSSIQGFDEESGNANTSSIHNYEEESENTNTSGIQNVDEESVNGETNKIQKLETIDQMEEDILFKIKTEIINNVEEKKGIQNMEEWKKIKHKQIAERNETEEIKDGDMNDEVDSDEEDADQDYINEDPEVDDDDFDDDEENSDRIRDIIITINDVDEKGNIIKSETINSREIVDFGVNNINK